jgi:uncharacterized Fe-S cluster-containing MiaB family protein
MSLVDLAVEAAPEFVPDTKRTAAAQADIQVEVALHLELALEEVEVIMSPVHT